MDEFMTPYDDDDAQFIECKVCEKSIRGETLFKIHLTSPGHLKKEDALVAVGYAVRRQNIPVFEHILHYLDYLKLDEPVIGLNYIIEVPNKDLQGDPRYKCSLCNQTAHLTEMVRHLIGRKHRQKYVEAERPELVTWSNRESHGGKIFKAKAEIIERQDGRGHPVLIARRPKDTRSHTSGGPQDVTSHLPRLMDFKMELGLKRGYTPQQPNTSLFHQENAYMLNQDHRDMHSRGHFEENVQRADHRGRDGCRQAPGDPEYHTNYKERYRQDEQRAVEFEPCFPKCESRSEMPRGWSRSSSQEYCTEEAPYRRGYPERDPLDIFRIEEIRTVQGRSPDYMGLHPDDDSLHWCPDRRQGSREHESTRSFPTEMASHQPHDLFVNGQLLQNHKIGDVYTKEAKPGPSRIGLSNLERNDDIPRFIPDIPEPFKRFLKGGTNDGEQGKRKRKSRFSDASMEEVAKTRRMFEVCGPSESKFGSYLPPERLSLRPEMYEIQHSGLIQGPNQSESYHRGGEKEATEEVVFDMLKNIEIDNKEEADFLKSKLCDLLKEFKAKKSDKAEKNLSRASISKEFNSLNPDDSLPTRYMYERILRENSDYRQQVENTNYHEDHRESVWEHRGHNIPEESHQEYNHSMHANPSYLNSYLNHNEDVFVRSEISSRQHGNHLSDAPSYPQVSLKPVYSHDDEEYLDFHSSAHSHHMERESSMERSGLYSSSLEKITLTLLELVKRQ